MGGHCMRAHYPARFAAEALFLSSPKFCNPLVKQSGLRVTDGAMLQETSSTGDKSDDAVIEKAPTCLPSIRRTQENSPFHL